MGFVGIWKKTTKNKQKAQLWILEGTCFIIFNKYRINLITFINCHLIGFSYLFNILLGF